MNWLKRGVATLVAVALLACSIIAASVSAAFANETCETGFGDRVPVVQVHGLDSDSEIWDSMGEELEEINEIFPERFDYRAASKEWVTHEDIGPKLARFIDCLAQASIEGGGKGKVIILAHSMGGLATRYAVNEAVGDRLVADEVGLVITIGTPHWGSDIAQLCEWFGFMPKCDGSAPLAMKPGSEELVNLPEFPDSIPVRAIAGDVTIHDELFNAEYTLDLDSDSVVGIDSATAFYSETGVGDDKRRFECDGKYDRVFIAILGVEASCEHTTMLSTDYVQDDVVQGIEAYLASTAEPEFDPDDGTWWTFFDKLAIPYLEQDWGGAMSEPEHFVSMRDYSDCPDGTTAGCPSFYFVNLDTIPEEYNDPTATADESAIVELQKWCEVDRDTLWSLLEVGVMNIGDKIADFYTLDECSAPQYLDEFEWDTRWVWYVEEERVMITASNSGEGTIDMEVMEESFRQAVWF